jgi:FtsH-binding integral membrane protein
MAFAQAARRPIEGAVATLDVSDRVAFLRRTYAHLGGALVLWAALTAGIFRYATDFSLSFSRFALRSQASWLLIMIAYIVIKAVARGMATSNTSRTTQYVGLFLAPLVEAMLLQPLIWLLYQKFGASSSTSPMEIIGQAAIVTLVVFVGLTATVFLTKKDFSFLRGALTVATFTALGIMVASMLFGFSLGMLFCAAMVVLISGWILYQTSAIMTQFPPTYHVAAALMLYGSIATLFWWVLSIMSDRRG